MNNTESLIQSARMHPKAILALVLIFPVFFGCFTFPLLNFSRLADNGFSYLYLPVMTLWVLYDLSIWAAARFEHWRDWQVWLTMTGLSLLGLVCRLALVWGEVSIATDFTPLNLLIHFGAYGSVFLFGIREAHKYL